MDGHGEVTHPPDTEVIAGPGAYRRLSELVGRLGARRVLVVGSATGLSRTRVVDQLAGMELATFTGFHVNPDIRALAAGSRQRDLFAPDLIVGIGGGSAMDAAKAIRVLPPTPELSVHAVTGAGFQPQPDIPALLLVPTMAGSGAEVTQFAAVYVAGRKHSLDHPRVRATMALVDPELTATCPPRTMYVGAFDALAHALESLWAVRSSAYSRCLAAEALTGLVALLREPQRCLEHDGRAALSRLATMAGLAIDLTRTTVAHAFAYPLTACYGIPHGLACALNLAWVLPLAAEGFRSRCADPRGPEFVHRRLVEVATVLGAGAVADNGAAIAELVRGTGMADRLGEYGVAQEDLAELVHAGARHERAANSPVALPDDMVGVLARRL